MKGYDEMTKLNKPFALSEIGPHTIDHQFDYSLW
jgi:mannan endo-1,4-beta-mannosidase